MRVLVKDFPAPILAGKKRITSIDLLRGLVMIIMALDHTRDFFHITAHTQDPTDLAITTPILFFTRWITHFCAPVFVFLAGTSAFLYGHRMQNKLQLSKFLLSRGLWLILLEVTIINFGFWFDVTFSFTVLQVIWAIGISMICLAGFIHLPFRFLLGVGLLIVFGHNLLDGISPPTGTFAAVLFSILHQPAPHPLDASHTIMVMYPVLPWIGLILVGYCFGYLYRPDFDESFRKKILLQVGLGCIVLFIILRAINFYGDPTPWSTQNTFTYSLLSFLNTTKYPPSLLYLLMTIGPALLFLRFIEGKKGELLKVFDVFGRVPLFYYILHFYTIHTFALLAALTAGYTWSDFQFTRTFGGLPEGFGYGLGRVYLVWICVVAILYPICKRYNRFKSKSTSVWVSYL
jgi:uncharacterized membrane protein